MARNLASQPNVNPASAAYPSGSIRDKDNAANPPVVGTPVTERIYGDVIEFFQKLLRLAGITANGNPDNETNGHQLIDALGDFVNDKVSVEANTRASADLLLAQAIENLDNSLGDAATKNTGTTTGTVCAGDDSRLSDSRKCNNTFDNAETSRIALGLGDSATKNVGTGAGTVAAGDHNHLGVYEPIGAAVALFANAWTSFSLIAISADVTVNSATVYYLKIGRTVFMNVVADFTVNTGSINGFSIQENGTNNAGLRANVKSGCAGNMQIPGITNESSGNFIIDDSSASNFRVKIKKYDGSIFSTGSAHTINFSIVYNSI